MEPLKHECGVAMVRLLKPLEYYQKKYGTWMWGINILYLLMEKQHNRGQEGAGLSCIKLNANPGEEFIFRERAVGTSAITEIFQHVHQQLEGFEKEQLADGVFAQEQIPFAGELYMGHLRYSTTGRKGLSYIHPFLRRNNWRSRNLVLCGNFNLTNVDEIFAQIAFTGQHPRLYADTYLLLEQLGYQLDKEVDYLYQQFKAEGLTGIQITQAIEQRMDLVPVLRKASALWDGGYVVCGMTGSGDSFALRDPWGIRTAFWYKNEEVMILASERPVIQTAMHVPIEEIHELNPGEALLLNREGNLRLASINKGQGTKACSFERIYFSRGSDQDIYKERKKLGERLVQPILKAVDYDIEHTVFSYIPNTAEVAFFGMLQGLDVYLNQLKAERIRGLGKDVTPEKVEQILSMRIRSEKVAIKDIKLRTFIAEGNNRNDLAAHVYDVTYGSLQPFIDNLVIIDDSIVRGTTLRQSIIRILNRLNPKQIVIVSSSPQVRYPDYYGIDMSSMEQFIAFKAAVTLLMERGMKDVIERVYKKVKYSSENMKHVRFNYIKEIYSPFTNEEIADKIAVMLTPQEVSTKVKIVYQTLEGLHESCPNHSGDWYFSGEYPTEGGLRLLNQAFINYIEKYYQF